MKHVIRIVIVGCLLSALSGAVWAQEEMSPDPLTDIATDMNSAAIRLLKLKTDKPTQRSQQEAIKKLDLLIKELEKRAGESGQGGGFGNMPAPDSKIISGPGGMGKLHDERREGKQWAELPAKERERIMRSMDEGFPSHYRKLLERYFISLADEKSAADRASDAEPRGKSEPRMKSESRAKQPDAAAIASPGDTKPGTNKDGK